MRRWVSFESKSAQQVRQGRPQAPPLAGLVSGKLVIYAAFGGGRAPLFHRRGLFGRRSFDVARFALLISFVQEVVNHARASLLLDPSLLRFLLLSEELVICFPAHCVLHRDRTNGMTTPQYRPRFQFLTSRSPPSKPSIIRPHRIQHNSRNNG